MIIKHELDREQRFGDGHQLAVIQGTAAVDIGLNGLAVAADVLTGFLGVNQAQRVFNAGQHADQLRHVGRILVVLADAQIERVFDAQDVFLDDRRDAFQQGVVPAEQTAFCMCDFFLVRHDPGQLENLVHLFERRRGTGVARDEIQKFLGQTYGGKVADFADAPVIEEIDFLIDFHQALFEGVITLDASVRERGKQGRSHPEQFAAGLLTALRADAAADRGQFTGGIGIRGMIQPTLKMGLELQRQRREIGIIGLAADLRKYIFRKRLLGRCGVNGFLAQNGFTTDRPQLVDQRQQHHRHVAVAVLQALEIIRQLHDALHQQ